MGLNQHKQYLGMTSNINELKRLEEVFCNNTVQLSLEVLLLQLSFSSDLFGRQRSSVFSLNASSSSVSLMELITTLRCNITSH